MGRDDSVWYDYAMTNPINTEIMTRLSALQDGDDDIYDLPIDELADRLGCSIQEASRALAIDEAVSYLYEADEMPGTECTIEELVAFAFPKLSK